MESSFCIRTSDEQLKPVARAVSERLKERGCEIRQNGFLVDFTLSPSLEEGAFEIKDSSGGVEIRSYSLIGLFHGAGYFLRHTEFTQCGAEPCQWRGQQHPHSQIRGMYFASHFHNYYHVASLEEMQNYMESLALWGVNTIMLCYPLINLDSMDHPDAKAELSRHAALIHIAHSIGLRCCESLSANMEFKCFPEEFKAAKNNDTLGRRGDTGPAICISKPGALERIDKINNFICAGLQDCGVDMVITWPYDEGGCGCKDCAPWGAKGFILASQRAFRIARSYFPQVLRCVSTWCFDTPYEGEWSALAASLESEKWLDIVLADSHEDFPKYPLENELYNTVPVINFPEISMWGLYPWGGWGATMLPERFSRLYLQTKGKLAGGFPYSEGIYEDLNKAVVTQFYWSGKAQWKETVTEYARYELGLNDAEPFLRLVSLVEKTHTEAATKGFCSTQDSDEAVALAKSIDESLPEWGTKSWRWRIIYLRAFIDARRYRIALERYKMLKLEIGNEHGMLSSDWTNWLAEEKDIQDAFGEISRIFHCREDRTDDPYHSRVSPMSRPIK